MKINVADSDCSYEIKRHLLLGRKTMTNLNSIFNSRDNTLPTKVHILKAMVFSVVMYGYESWTIKEGWTLKNWCFWTVVLEKTLESPSNCKEIKPINPKGNQSWIFIGGTDAEVMLQYFGHLMQRANSLEKTLMLGKTEGRRRKGRQRMAGWHHWLNGHEFEQALGDGEGQGSLACLQSTGSKRVEHDWETEQQQMLML